MRGHRAPDLRLFADDHALQQAGVVESELGGDLGVELAGAAGVGDGGEGRDVGVQRVADLVDGSFFGAGQHGRVRGEGVFFEEEAHLVAGGQEVRVPDVGGGGGGRGRAGGEFGHRVVFEREVVEEGADGGEEGGACGLVEVVWHDEIAVGVEFLELLGSEAIA